MEEGKVEGVARGMMENNNNKNNNNKATSTNNKNVSGVRRRVYAFGILCMFIALGQIAIYLMILTFSISEEYSDYQVATGSGSMIVLTSIYLGLTGRMLFLLFERRYEEAKGPEWMWWYSSVAMVLFNLTLVAWFWLLSDYIPAGVCGFAAIIYFIFFIFASKDIKHISDNDDKVRWKRVPCAEENGDLIEPIENGDMT